LHDGSHVVVSLTIFLYRHPPRDFNAEMPNFIGNFPCPRVTAGSFFVLYLEKRKPHWFPSTAS